MRCFDAHNHLQDERFGGAQESLVAACRDAGVVAMVVNGACAADWPEVIALARRHPDIVRPSLGWHPWYLHERGEDWLVRLEEGLARHPEAAVGEIGLDRWILEQPPEVRGRYVLELAVREPVPIGGQVEAFRSQVALARRFERPFTVHCLQAWGFLLPILREEAPFPRGFLLHSYGGSAELVGPLARLGAYFSFPGYFLHPRKARQLAVFRDVPRDRLLVETDAPDQCPPEAFRPHRILAAGPGDKPLNHPANLPAIQEGLGRFLGEDPATLAARLEANFTALFG